MKNLSSKEDFFNEFNRIIEKFLNIIPYSNDFMKKSYNLIGSSTNCKKIVIDNYFFKFQVNFDADNLLVDNINGIILNNISTKKDNSPRYFSKYIDGFNCVLFNNNDEYIFSIIMIKNLINKFMNDIEYDDKFICVPLNIQNNLKNYLPLYYYINNYSVYILNKLNELFNEIFNLNEEYGFVHNDLHLNNIMFKYDTVLKEVDIKIIDYGRASFDIYKPFFSTTTNFKIKNEINKINQDNILLMPEFELKNLTQNVKDHVKPLFNKAYIYDISTLTMNILTNSKLILDEFNKNTELDLIFFDKNQKKTSKNNQYYIAFNEEKYDQIKEYIKKYNKDDKKDNWYWFKLGFICLKEYSEYHKCCNKIKRPKTKVIYFYNCVLKGIIHYYYQFLGITYNINSDILRNIFYMHRGGIITDNSYNNVKSYNADKTNNSDNLIDEETNNKIVENYFYFEIVQDESFINKLIEDKANILNDSENLKYFSLIFNKYYNLMENINFFSKNSQKFIKNIKRENYEEQILFIKFVNENVYKICSFYIMKLFENINKNASNNALIGGLIPPLNIQHKINNTEKINNTKKIYNTEKNYNVKTLNNISELNYLSLENYVDILKNKINKKDYEIKAIIAFIYNILINNESPLYSKILNIALIAIKDIF